MKEEGGEKLYRINCMTYVQYNGKGKMPEALDGYLQTHKGEFPPFMHLPEGKVTFRLKYGGSVDWSGKGPLPEPVINFVTENGVLPRYGDTDIPDSMENDNDYDEDDEYDEYEDEEEDDEWRD